MKTWVTAFPGKRKLYRTLKMFKMDRNTSPSSKLAGYKLHKQMLHCNSTQMGFLFSSPLHTRYGQFILKY